MREGVGKNRGKNARKNPGGGGPGKPCLARKKPSNEFRGKGIRKRGFSKE